jgi:hypothetical protein
MRRVIAIIVAVVVVAAAYRLIKQQIETQKSSQAKADPTAEPIPETDSTFDSFADSVRKGADLTTCQSMLQQVNAYFASHPDDRPSSLTAEQRSFLKKQYSLDDSELAEVAGVSFTQLDGHYLEVTLLLRDVVGTFRLQNLSPLEQASRAFAWVIRQIGLQAPHPDAFPPQFVVQRGLGTALERAFVFQALLDHLNIDNCMLALPGPKPGDVRQWIPAALIDNNLYLFDTRLGFPVPGPNGKGVATLKEVQDHPELLQALTLDAKFPYDVKPEDVQHAEVEMACNLSAMSPRMRYLQEKLAANEKVPVYVDAEARQRRFQTALKTEHQSRTLKGWNSAGDKDNPIRVLRAFLPPPEGGTDTSHRQELGIRELVPWQSLPVYVQQLPGETGNRLRNGFAMPFKYFYTEPRMPRDLMSSWLPGIVEGPSHGDTPGKASELVMREHLPRDLVLRGKFDEATTLLVAMRTELKRQRMQRLDPGRIQEWFDQALQVDADLLRARRTGGDPGALAAASERHNQLWSPQRVGPVSTLIQVSAAESMLDEVGFQLALCKQEQAERLQSKMERDKVGNAKNPKAALAKSMKGPWTTAAGWWETYLDQAKPSGSYPRDFLETRASSARLLEARARAALGQAEKAAELLRIWPASMTSLEKTGRLYMAKQLQSR